MSRKSEDSYYNRQTRGSIFIMLEYLYQVGKASLSIQRNNAILVYRYTVVSARLVMLQNARYSSCSSVQPCNRSLNLAWVTADCALDQFGISLLPVRLDFAEEAVGIILVLSIVSN